MPKFKASATPTIVIPKSKLLHNLVACPQPTDPQRTTFDPIFNNSVSTDATDLSHPPAMNVKVPFSALITPKLKTKKN